MIFGNGIDIIEIERIKNIIEKNSRFIEKNFTDNEIKYFTSKKKSFESIAGYFAAKEAVSKALGTGVRGFGLKDIEIIKDKYGKPNVVLHNNASEILKINNISTVMISISHCEKFAVANAITVLGEGK